MWYFGMLGTCYPMVYHPWMVRNIFNSYSMSPFPWMWATFYHALHMHISHATPHGILEFVLPYSYFRPGIQLCTTLEWSKTFWAFCGSCWCIVFLSTDLLILDLWWHFGFILPLPFPMFYHSWKTWYTLNICYICALPNQHHLTQPEVTIFSFVFMVPV